MGLQETSMEYLPFATATVGYAAGIAAAMFAQRNRAKQAGIVESHSHSVFELPEHPGLVGRIGMAATAGVALASGAIGLANGLAWQEAPAIESMPARLNVVVDHSGSTRTGEDPVAEQIALAVEQFIDQDIESQALVASGGEVAVVEIEAVAAENPFGDAPLEQAVQLAIDTSTGLHAQAIAEGDQRITGTVVITNGNPIGNPESVTTAALAANEPLFVINIEDSVQDEGVSEGLKAIAENTGGQYWNIDATAEEDIISDITDTVVDARTEDDNQPINWKNRILAGVVTLVSVPLAYKRTKREPFSVKGSIRKARR